MLIAPKRFLPPGDVGIARDRTTQQPDLDIAEGDALRAQTEFACNSNALQVEAFPAPFQLAR